MEVCKKCQAILALLSQNPHFTPGSKLQEVLGYVFKIIFYAGPYKIFNSKLVFVFYSFRKLQKLDLDLGRRCLPSFQVVSGLAATRDGCEPLTDCLQPLLAIEVMQNPCADTYAFVSQLRMIQRLKVVQSLFFPPGVLD